jgi:hypothetical protein
VHNRSGNGADLLLNSSLKEGMGAAKVILFTTQEILRKFEFFPIKCRIQRAEEVFRAAVNEDPQLFNQHHAQSGQQPSEQSIKTKVSKGVEMDPSSL